MPICLVDKIIHNYMCIYQIHNHSAYTHRTTYIHTYMVTFYSYTQVFLVKRVCWVDLEEEDCQERQAHQDLKDLKAN